MSLNFVKADWITTGKKWANLPPRVKRATKNEFRVPTSMQEAIDNDGTIVRVGTAEGTLLIEDKGMVELGQGHHTKTGSKRYRGEWEGH